MTRSLEASQPSLIQRTSPFLALALLLAAAVAGAAVGLGWVEVRRPLASPPSGPEKAAPGPPAPTDVGPSIQRIPEQETAFQALGGKARVFRYRGGPLRCWVETASGTKKKAIGEVRNDHVPNQAGVIVWLARESGAAKEGTDGLISVPRVWDLGLRGEAAEASSTTTLKDQKFVYPAPEADKAAPRKGKSLSDSSTVREQEIERVELKTGEPVCLYSRATTSTGADGRTVELTLRLMCELLPLRKARGEVNTPPQGPDQAQLFSASWPLPRSQGRDERTRKGPFLCSPTGCFMN
jgi:hypothetical protein